VIITRAIKDGIVVVVKVPSMDIIGITIGIRPNIIDQAFAVKR
jgi:hypothetical protein